ncbi:oligosaccharide flippase family protein [Flavobacteriales bacterium]|nr:oligosaccharide flippase family protein [Flavobacteriales bacterium]
MNPNPLKQLANQTAIYGLSSVIGRLLNYLLVPLYTRYFLPAEYGVVTEMYAYVAFLVVVLTYGMETAFFRFSKKENDANVVYSTTLISLLVTSLIFVGLIFSSSSSIADWMGYHNHKEYIEWFAIIIGLDAISSISFASLREKNKAIRFAVIRLINIFVNIGLNIFFIVYKEYGIEYIFISNLISSIVTIVLLFPEMLKSIWIFDNRLWKKMMVYALPLLIAGLAGMTNETIDRILLKHLLPNPDVASSELGLYGAFYKLSIIMILFIQTFRFAAEPFFFTQEKEGKSRKIYADVMKYFTIITAIIFLIVTIFYDLIKQFIGNEYHDERGFLVVSILLLANLFLGMYYNLSIWYKLTDKTKYGAYLSIFGAFITLTLNFMFIPIIGFVGSAWATLACYFSMTIASFYLGEKHFPIPYNLKRIGLYLLVMLSIYLIIAITDINMWINSLYLLAFIILIFILEKPKKMVFSSPKSPN